jgi:L-rhamnose mutarotase
VLKLADHHRLAELPKHPVMRKWWDYMADLMVANPDRSPQATDLKQVFYLP